MEKKIEEGDLVLCTVKRIVGTTVFVNIEENEKEATIITSEIAPGRIRNLRDYVVPGKKIICKILNIDKTGNVHLSLRRVTEKEKKQVQEIHQKERNALSILKTVNMQEAEKTAEKIKKKFYLYDFLQNAKQNPKILEQYFPKPEAEKILKILRERKEKQIEIKKQFSLSTSKSNGITIIKKILSPYKDKIIYLAAGKFTVKIKADDYKKANQELQKILKQIEQDAEKQNLEFQMKEK